MNLSMADIDMDEPPSLVEASEETDETIPDLLETEESLVKVPITIVTGMENMLLNVREREKMCSALVREAKSIRV